MAKTFYEYFGWKENPFSLKVDPDTFVGYENQVNELKNFIDEEERVALLLGPTGSGKTTLLQYLLKNYRNENKILMYLVKPPKDKFEFRDIFLEQFPMSLFERILKGKPTIYNLHKYVNSKLQGRHLVLLIDEAHETNVDVLEWLRVFSDQIEKVSIIFAALPHFENFVKENLTTLYERVTTKVSLGSLSRTEVYLLIKKRIEKAGGDGIKPFTEEAISKIHEITGGLPREVLKIAAKVCEYAFRNNIKEIDHTVVEEAVFEKFRTKEDIFRILDSLTPKQRKILEILATKGPLATSDILKYIDLSEYKDRQNALRAVNNILKRLMDMGLVKRRREGNKYIYYVIPKIEALFVSK